MGHPPGDLVEIKDPNGNVICNEYDPMHRVTATKYPNGPNASVSNERHFVYDAAVVNGITMQNGKGRLVYEYVCGVAVCSGKPVQIGYSYDAKGQLVTYLQNTYSDGGVWDTLNYSYFENGALSGMTTNLTGLLPSFSIVPNGQGQTQQVLSSDVSNPVLISNVLYNNAGLATEVDFSSGKKDTFLYDTNTNRWEKGTYNVGSSSMVVDPSWNPNGSLNSVVITDPNNSLGDQDTCAYAKDDLARLARVNCANWTQTFTYDSFGNVSKSGTSSWLPGYNGQNRYLLSGSSYDSNGNLLADTYHTYTWDSNNLLASVDTYGVRYGASGKEMEWNAGGSWYQGIDTAVGKILTHSSSTMYAARISLGNGIIAKYNQTVGLEGFLHSDWRGNVVLETSPTGSYVGSAAVAPFGEQYAANNLSNFFMGLGSDSISGETDTASRKFQWVSGRFIQPDPSHSSSLTNPQSLNLYAYVNNAPMEQSDPSGLMGDGSPYIGGSGFCCDDFRNPDKQDNTASDIMYANHLKMDAQLDAMAEADGAVMPEPHLTVDPTHGGHMGVLSAWKDGGLVYTPTPDFIDFNALVRGFLGFFGIELVSAPTAGIDDGPKEIPLPTNLLWIDKIVNGHGWAEHGQYDFQSREEYKRLVLDTVQNATGKQVQHPSKGRTLFWNDDEGFAVWRNTNNPDQSTAFHPDPVDVFKKKWGLE